MRTLLLLLLLLNVQEAAFAQAPPPGMYRSSENYLSLHPSDTAIVFRHIAGMEGDGLNSFYRLLPNGRRGEALPAKDYFAASDGATFYIPFDNKWYKAYRTDSGYYFVRPRNAAEIDHKGHRHVYAGPSYDRTDITAMVEGDQKYRFFYDPKEGRWKPVDKFRRK